MQLSDQPPTAHGSSSNTPHPKCSRCAGSYQRLTAQLTDQLIPISRMITSDALAPNRRLLRDQLPALNSAAHQLIPISRRIASDALAPNRQLRSGYRRSAVQLSDRPLHSSRHPLKHPTPKMQPLRDQQPALNSALTSSSSSPGGSPVTPYRTNWLLLIYQLPARSSALTS